MHSYIRLHDDLFYSFRFGSTSLPSSSKTCLGQVPRDGSRAGQSPRPGILWHTTLFRLVPNNNPGSWIDGVFFLYWIEPEARELKLPRGFKVPTPIGSYIPDWAVILENDKRIYFVAETKGTLDRQLLREVENMKIACGEKHFALFKPLGVEYKLAVKTKDLY